MKLRARQRCVIALLYLVPVCIGVLFWADTSGHGDSAVYRKFILDLHQTGVLPLMAMEWYHPGHYLMVWPVFALGEAVGAWDDPLRAISLVEFVSTGWAAHAVYCTWTALRPDDDKLVPLSAAAALATMPAWLWQSQEGMSDVVGTAFVIGVTCRLLRHGERAETTGSWALTGFLAAWAGLIRVSSGLFLPLWGCLVLRAILRNQRLAWSRVALGIGLGALLPLALVYGYLFLAHGADAMGTLYFTFSGDNTRPWSRVLALPETIRAWCDNLWRGMGYLGPVAAVGCVSLVIRHRGFLWLTVLLLPYLVGVANNRASSEFRYMLPITGYLALGYAAVVGHLQLRLGIWAARAFVVLLALQALWHAYPVLDRVRTRQNFEEVAARRMIAHAPRHSLLVGHSSHPFLTMLTLDSRGQPIADRMPMAIKVSGAQGGADVWNQPWSRANSLVAFHATEGRRIFCSDESGTEGWRTQLRQLGWRERALEKIPFHTLRGQYEHDMTIPPGQERTRPLTILELLPPRDIPRVGLRIEQVEVGGVTGLRFHVSAPDQAGRDYQILVAGQVADSTRAWAGHVDVPFPWDDPFVELSRAMGVAPSKGVRGFAGRLDEKGHAEAFVPGSNLANVQNELAATVLIFDDLANPATACTRSGMVTVPVK